MPRWTTSPAPPRNRRELSALSQWFQTYAPDDMSIATAPAYVPGHASSGVAVAGAAPVDVGGSELVSAGAVAVPVVGVTEVSDAPSPLHAAVSAISAQNETS